jgi:hypothetical protein
VYPGSFWLQLGAIGESDGCTGSQLQAILKKTIPWITIAEGSLREMQLFIACIGLNYDRPRIMAYNSSRDIGYFQVSVKPHRPSLEKSRSLVGFGICSSVDGEFESECVNLSENALSE